MFIPETLVPAIKELESAYHEYKNDPTFMEDLEYYLNKVCRQTYTAVFRKKFDRILRRIKHIFKARRFIAWRGS